ncbi:MAG: SDR family NAD(P)-dependent oxidoreductase [Clostridia bacterium]|nr:SDR family NAD(P)-dependent oxidoreductase [Clostridia bacterium]
MKTVVITGATSGIGLETARILTGQGYSVIGIGHSAENCVMAKESILFRNPDAKIIFFTADLMQQREVIRAADEIAKHLDTECGGELYALINNAGCVRSWYMTTDEGYEQQFALNHLASFLLTHKLLACLKMANGLVIMTGSESHKRTKVRWNDIMLSRGYNPLFAYKQSKLCNILFAKGLNDRCASSGIRAYVVDPGLVKTDIGNKNTGSLVNLVWKIRKRFGVPPSVPAQTYAFLCGQAEKAEGLYYYLCKENKYSNSKKGGNNNDNFPYLRNHKSISFGIILIFFIRLIKHKEKHFFYLIPHLTNAIIHCTKFFTDMVCPRGHSGNNRATHFIHSSVERATA